MAVRARIVLDIVVLGMVAMTGLLSPPAFAEKVDPRQEACKAAMNARIQVCTDDCTARALAAASNYVDTNHNVKFGCLKGCALGQIFQMRACVNGSDATSNDPTETNRH